MSLIPFPNIPDVFGVPAIPRSPNFPVVNATLGIIQGIIYRAIKTTSRWGVFDASGKPLGDPAQFTDLTGGAIEALGLGSTYSFNALDYSKESRISDFPVERGGFASYNKVETPANPIVTLCLSGTEANRRSFLDAIDAASKSIESYSVVTPEVTYINYNVERYTYVRTNSKGATLLTVEITLKEIRQVSALYTTATPIEAPKDVGATPTVDNGKVQAKTPKESVLRSIINKLPVLGGT